MARSLPGRQGPVRRTDRERNPGQARACWAGARAGWAWGGWACGGCCTGCGAAAGGAAIRLSAWTLAREAATASIAWVTATKVGGCDCSWLSAVRVWFSATSACGTSCVPLDRSMACRAPMAWAIGAARSRSCGGMFGSDWSALRPRASDSRAMRAVVTGSDTVGKLPAA